MWRAIRCDQFLCEPLTWQTIAEETKDQKPLTLFVYDLLSKYRSIALEICEFIERLEREKNDEYAICVATDKRNRVCFVFHCKYFVIL